MRPPFTYVLHLMRQARHAAREQGVELVFPFIANDVEAIHTCCHRYGDRIYFRLKDGRVFSLLGSELDPNPAVYGDSQLAGTPPVMNSMWGHASR
jgi:hypothetical protein